MTRAPARYTLRRWSGPRLTVVPARGPRALWLAVIVGVGGALSVACALTFFNLV